jgi:hypothetical protein
MNPFLSARMAAERRRDLEALAGSGRSRRPPRHSVGRALGLGLIRAGRRLAGPDDPADRPGLRRMPGTQST